MRVKHFGELAGLARTLQTARQEVEAMAARERQRAAHETHERNLFAASVGPVIPLRKPASMPPARARPGAIARQRLLDEARVLQESLSDDFDATWLLETDAELSFRRRGVGADVLRKLRRGVWVTQSQLDLHGLRREAAREKLLAFLRDAGRGGQRCVRIIHGKGNGSPGRESVLKSKVKGWLVQRNDVIAFVQARAADGGHGALLVLLRPGTAA
ncbi:MAG: Smr/MutS family protein [Burkholderiales bacterium]|jgi:DNA-nicking Smr family endonuclease|nr:Smr/MutS family protein [Burkholderiales bacterium]